MGREKREKERLKNKKNGIVIKQEKKIKIDETEREDNTRRQKTRERRNEKKRAREKKIGNLFQGRDTVLRSLLFPSRTQHSERTPAKNIMKKFLFLNVKEKCGSI